MNAKQARERVAETFPKPFNRERFLEFSRNLLNKFDESKAAQWNATYVKDAFKPHVARFERLGTYTSPEDEKLDVLVAHLTNESKLERARTAIRNFVADHLKTRDEKDAALVAFVSPTEQQWRFSYVKMEYTAIENEAGRVGVETRLTPARRFSYIVGEGESCHTAQTRFLDLLQDTDQSPTLAQVEEAFSVEAVTKEFFKKYAELFGEIQKALDRLAKKDPAIAKEFDKKSVRTADFAKKLMGQIVFLYFIQKKGWLGGERGKDWGTGPHDFLRRLAGGEYGKYENFFNDILEPLFYDTLATDRGHEAWCKRFNCRIPFLNGGLFEPLADYDWRKTDIILPNRLFTNNDRFDDFSTGTGLLDMFDRYNFTVNEAEPLEKEVAIDPEMLGKVFENLIEENLRKGLGSYYTPREIVHYMCQESLINYLDTSLNSRAEPIGKEKRKQAEFGDDKAEQTLLTAATRHEIVPRADIETFVHLGDQISHYEAVETHYAIKMPKSIEKHARLIDEKLADITICDPAVGSGAFPVGMMSEIVRARSALTPYFNETRERTAYRFKLDAIQNSLYGVDIDPGAVEIAKLRLWLSLVVDEEDLKQIKPLPNLFYKIVTGNSLLGFPFKSQRVHKIENLKAEYFDETDHDKKRRIKREIDSELGQAFAASKTSLGYEVTFDFQIYFSEVFRTSKGFDVIIANPPYVSVEKFARTALQTAWKQTFETYAARADIYCFFYEQGLTLLRPGGVLTFISSNKFQRAGYGKALRQLLVGQQIHTLIDFCELPVFAAATDPMIVVAAKAPAVADREFPVLVVKDEAEFSSLPQSVVSRASRYKVEQLKAEGWSLEGSDGLALVDELRAKGAPLVTCVNGMFYYGIKTGLNEAYVLDRATRDRLIREDRKSADLIKPWIRGKDIKRWIHEFHDLYVIIMRFGFHTELKNYPAIHRHLATFEEKLKARGQCRTSRGGSDKGQHHWLELDNNPSIEFLSLFGKDRVVLPIIKKTHGFAFVKGGSCSNDKTTFFLSTEALFLLAVLNSTVIEWIVRMEFPGLGDPWAGGRIEYRAGKVKGLPIPPASAADKAKLTKLAERAAKAATAGDAGTVARIERDIDEIIYRLFDLTAAEIHQIETALANTRVQSADDENDDE
jgi:type I restriction-modification system DNA methylase subunit